MEGSPVKRLPSSFMSGAESSADTTLQSLSITQLPESLVLQIFRNLCFTSLCRASQVCHQWSRVGEDDLLWRSVFLRHYKLPSSTTLPAHAASWRSEFKRLYYHTPVLLSAVQKEIEGDILHVSFSNNGRLFATCSTDGSVKVWRINHGGVDLLFKEDMNSLFSWHYAQFSQFNETDACLLVSGVYFSGLETGEIVVFNLLDDFKIQCRLMNKPSDAIGAWYDADHLLSGILYSTGGLNSVSAIWLSRASQEVEQSVESVSLVLYRFQNENASSVKLINVAQMSGAPACCTERHKLSMLDKLLRKQISEEEFDLENEDADYSDDDNVKWEEVVEEDISDRNEMMAASQMCCCSTREGAECCSHASNRVKGLCIPYTHSSTSVPVDSGCKPCSNCRKGVGTDSLAKSSQTFHMPNCMSFREHDILATSKNQNTCDLNNLTSCVSNKKEAFKSSSVDISSNMCLNFSNSNNILDNCDICQSTRLSNTSSCDKAHQPSLSTTYTTTCKRNQSVNESSCFFDNIHSTTAVSNTSTSLCSQCYQSCHRDQCLNDSQQEQHHQQSDSCGRHCRIPPEKLLIYAFGTATSIPHLVGFKRIHWTDFNKGEVTARRFSMLPGAMEHNLHSGRQPYRRDVPDHVINMHGLIVGLRVAPDQRYLYINCRKWPTGYRISDPLESPPLAQEMEIWTVDLWTFEFVGRVLRSHKSFTHSDDFGYLGMDVSHLYVASGAEDKQGWLWDRHYGIPLYRFPHGGVVNCVALNPADSEMLVTVGADSLIKVWMSRHKINSLNSRKSS